MKSEKKPKFIIIQQVKHPFAWKLGELLFGKYGSNQNNLSKNRKKYFFDKIKAKKH